MAPRTILVIDDDIQASALAKEALEAAGYEVLTANSGEKVLEIAGGERKPDLVFMNIDLEADFAEGAETAGPNRDEHGLPVVFLAGRADANLLAKIGSERPLAIIPKLPGFEVFLPALVETALEGSQLRGRLESLKAELHRRLGESDAALAEANAAAEKILAEKDAALGEAAAGRNERERALVEKEAAFAASSESLKAELEALHGTLMAAVVGKTELEKTLAEKESALSAVGAEAESMRTRLAEAAAAARESDARVEALAGAKTELENALQQSQAAWEEAVAARKDAETRLAEKDAALGEAAAGRNELKRALVEKEAAFAASSESLKTEREALRGKLTAAEGSINEQADRLESLSVELETLKADLRRKGEEAAALAAERDGLAAGLRGAESRAEALRSELQSSRARAARMIEEKTLIIRETKSRVRNNLAVFSSLLSLEVERLHDPRDREIFRTMRGRIRSMALVYDQLDRTDDALSVDAKAYFEGLSRELVSALAVRPGQVKLVTDFAPFRLDVKRAVSCAFILTELVSNSLKHAFPGGRRGMIVARSVLQPETFVLSVLDDGVGLPKGLDIASLNSFGLKYVHMQAGLMGGSVKAKSEQGAEIDVEVPLNPPNSKD